MGTECLCENHLWNIKTQTRKKSINIEQKRSRLRKRNFWGVKLLMYVNFPKNRPSLPNSTSKQIRFFNEKWRIKQRKRKQTKAFLKFSFVIFGNKYILMSVSESTQTMNGKCLRGFFWGIIYFLLSKHRWGYYLDNDERKHFALREERLILSSLKQCNYIFKVINKKNQTASLFRNTYRISAQEIHKRASFPINGQ